MMEQSLEERARFARRRLAAAVAGDPAALLPREGDPDWYAELVRDLASWRGADVGETAFVDGDGEEIPWQMVRGYAEELYTDSDADSAGYSLYEDFLRQRIRWAEPR